MTPAIEAPMPPRRTAVFAGLLFFLLCFAAVGLIAYFKLRGLVLAPVIAAPLLAYVYFIRRLNDFASRSGCGSAAMRRYNRRMAVITIAYIAALVAAVWIANRYAPAGILAWLLAIVPAVPVLAMIWAMGRLLTEETDEYLREQTVRLSLFATGFMLSVVTVWGFLETFELVPHVPAYGAFIVWCIGLGAGGCVAWMRR